MNNDNLESSPVLTRPTLRLGNQGEYVQLLQTILSSLMFYGGKINGEFDNETSLSVKAFQTNNKLTADGIVGRDTWSALIYLYSPLPICDTSMYIVQSGDTLFSIARKYNTTVDEIMKLNNLTSTSLSVGQRLIITGEGEIIPPTINEYIVKGGDTLFSIARKHNTTVDEIMRLNNLTNSSLSIGQKLIIASEGIEMQPSPTQYIVKSGDTLFSIARKYNTTVTEIMRLNNLTSSSLSIGQRLTIANNDSNLPSPTITTYTVKRGDTLWDIANKYNTTVNSIKNLNNLKSNLLSIGQVLKIK